MNQQLEEYLAAYRADWIKAGPPSPHVTIAMVGEIARLRDALAGPMEAAARIAEAVHPSAASAVGEAHMRSYRDAIAHAIRSAALPSRKPD